jgi:hypothetical protein
MGHETQNGGTEMLMGFILEMFGSNPGCNNDRYNIWCYSLAFVNIPES